MNNGDKSDRKEFLMDLRDVSNLMERQSVRATFRLSIEFIDALRALSAQLGIKQKSLFDHLMEDKESLRAIAERISSNPLDKKTRIQKTFVISKKSLNALDIVSKASEASRDDLVEYSIQRLLPLLIEEQKKQHKRELALGKIADHFAQATNLLDDILTIVGEDDPIYKTMDSVLMAYENALDHMEDMITTGKRITNLSMEKFKS